MKTLTLLAILFLISGAAFGQSKKEIVSKRSYNSKTYDNGGGSYSLEVSLAYWHYKDAAGKFRPIKRDFVPSGQKAYSYEVTEGLYALYLKGASAEQNNVTFNDRTGASLGFSLLSMGYYERSSRRYREIESFANVTAQVKGNHAWFPGVANGIDLEYIYQSDRLKENIHLSQQARKALPDPAKFGFKGEDTYLMFQSAYDPGKLRLFDHNTDVTDADHATTHRLAFKDGGGNTLFFFSNDLAGFVPVNDDGSDEEMPVLKRIYNSGGNRLLLSGVPLSWLNGLGAGEVVIDPSVTLNTAQTCQDAFVYKWDGDAATQDYNYGSSTIIRTLAWTKSGINKYERSFLQFDLTALPVGARITGAKLRLTNDGGQHAGGNASRYGQSSTYLRRVTGPWNEYSLTWNTQPTSTTEHQIAVPAPTSGTDSLVQDVMPLVKDILNSEEGNHGFELILQNEQKYRSVRYASTQHSDAARWPKLSITYTRVNEAYYLKDHLGNIRVTLDGNGNVVTSDDYYPFGLLERSHATGRQAETPIPRGKCLVEAIILP